MEQLLPGLGPQWVAGRYEPSCRDMDVAAIHQGFLRMAAQSGAELICNAGLLAAERGDGRWLLTTRAGQVAADVVVIAAGAWADAVAALLGARPLGIQPLRRTVVQADVEPRVPSRQPLVLDVAGRFYFKPEGGGVWISPHDETPDRPGDVQPEELDVAIAIDRFEKAGDWRVRRVSRSWAGLRSFAPDRAPVYGFDPLAPGVFWCAGQGGFGIQTAPAGSMLAAALLMGAVMPQAVAAIDAGRYAPARFLRG
jgi:D-arginine dehydrogenase